RLGIRFDMSGEELQLYLPNGEIFQGIEQIKEQLQQTEEQLQQKDEQLQLLAAKLREMGINPDELK
ncbi:MAG: Uma2 family endonuclease, partial [Microcoleaceae cyanobacterium]